MRPRHVLMLTTTFLAAIVSGSFAVAQEGFENWQLEPGLAQAQLVMVARVASISKLTVVEGAKTDIALREYRFQPIRRLKGIFQRDQLSMTAVDLGCPPEDAAQAPPLREGEYRLLILTQQEGRYLGCVSAAPGMTTFDERVPALAGPDDPLVAVAETLIRVADSRSRRERAALLVERLADVKGVAAVPLLSSLRQRADWAAADPRAYAALAPLVTGEQIAVRIAALETLRDVLAHRIVPSEPEALDGIAKALRTTAESNEPIAKVRLTTLQALGHLLALRSDLDWSHGILIGQMNDAPTYAERAAAATALAQVAHASAGTALLAAFAALPLDESPERETEYATAAAKRDPAGAERALLARLEQSIAARQSLEAEIDVLAGLRSNASVPLLLAAARHLQLSSDDRYHIAWAVGRLQAEAAVPQLTEWLHGDDHYLRDAALTSLESIDSDAAAVAARPMLKSEGHLPYKLRIARLLARHGIVDGYALATEHLADSGQTAGAALVLAALDDPRTPQELSSIIESRPDRGWHAAALSGLAAIDDVDAGRQLGEILANDRHPLAAEAAEAAGLSSDNALLNPLAKLVRSRNRQIALSSLVALRRYLSGVRTSTLGLAAVDAKVNRRPDEPQRDIAELSAETRAAIAEDVASIVTDTYVETDLRQEGLAVARLLGGDTYAKLLSTLADQAELEGSALLTNVESELRQLRSVN